jgi:hypothetical protein
VNLYYSIFFCLANQIVLIVLALSSVDGKRTVINIAAIFLLVLIYAVLYTKWHQSGWKQAVKSYLQVNQVILITLITASLLIYIVSSMD